VKTGQRWLIVNADDFGQSQGINRGVVTAHEHGIVTSASLMVRWPAAVEAAAYARDHPRLSLGLHIDFGEWAFRDEHWVPLYMVASDSDANAAAQEVAHQLHTFQHLVGAAPTHLDSHQHVHRKEPLHSILGHEARRLGIPLRDANPAVRYDGSFYGQSGRGYPVPAALSVAALVQLIHALPPGVTELGCHPGDVADSLESMYRDERAQEVQTLCDMSVRAAVEAARVRLCSFPDVACVSR
jgi:chitin disaccharide deacetylase